MSDMNPSERELDVLKVLWTLGEAKVRDVHEAMCREEKCASPPCRRCSASWPTRALVKPRSTGRTLFYSPVYTREQLSSRFLHRVFDGALDKLVLNMLAAEDLSPEEMRELEKLIAKARRDLRKGGLTMTWSQSFVVSWAQFAVAAFAAAPGDAGGPGLGEAAGGTHSADSDLCSGRARCAAAHGGGPVARLAAGIFSAATEGRWRQARRRTRQLAAGADSTIATSTDDAVRDEGHATLPLDERDGWRRFR